MIERFINSRSAAKIQIALKSSARGLLGGCIKAGGADPTKHFIVYSYTQAIEECVNQGGQRVMGEKGKHSEKTLHALLVRQHKVSTTSDQRLKKTM